jgi:phosphotransferase system  glucose/maltose/N-acetylglucosamine-specific IIC component
MFSNKFGVGIVYVFKVGIIRIILKILLIRNNNFSIFFIPNFLQFRFYFIFCEFALFKKNIPTRIAKLKKFKSKKKMLVGGGEC